MVGFLSYTETWNSYIDIDMNIFKVVELLMCDIIIDRIFMTTLGKNLLLIKLLLIALSLRQE